MAESSAESTVGKYFGAPIGGALIALLTWATTESTRAFSPALISLLTIVGAACGAILTLLYQRYLDVLGADRRKPAERQAYDALRGSLVEGNLVARLYADRLTRFLNWIDRFFGDAGIADRTLFPHAFGAKDASTALDRTGLRTLPPTRLNLPDRNDPYRLGHFRSRRSGRIGSASGS